MGLSKKIKNKKVFFFESKEQQKRTKMFATTTTKTKTACSNHQDAAAVSYCRACKKFMCARCEGLHSEFLGKDHDGSVVSANSVGNNSGHPFCDKCATHTEYPLDTVCKDCNGTPFIFLITSFSFSLTLTFVSFLFLFQSSVV